MGTRRSKHNYGRKPCYKNIDRDSARNFDWLAEPPPPHEKIIPIVRNTKPRPASDVALEESVARFLAGRKRTQVISAQTAASVGNDCESHIIDTFRNFSDSTNMAPGDILFQLFAERKINVTKFNCGRNWQFDMEAVSIQPIASIDWSSPKRSYQSRGTITERQFTAMKRRQEMRKRIGIISFSMLDLCLAENRNRRDLVALLRCSGSVVNSLIIELLNAIEVGVIKENHCWNLNPNPHLGGILTQDPERTWSWKTAQDAVAANSIFSPGTIGADVRHANTIIRRPGRDPVVVERNRKHGMRRSYALTHMGSMPIKLH